MRLSQRQRLVLGVIVMVVLGNTAQIAGRQTVLLSAAHLGASPSAIGVLMALLSVPGLLFSIPIGRLFDRYDRPSRLIGLSLLLLGAGAALPAAWFELPALFGAILLLGLGVNILQVGAQNLVGQYSDEPQRLRSFSWLSVGFSTSMLLAPLISGFSIDGLGHRWAFALIAISPVVAWLLLMYRPLPPVHHPGSGQPRAQTASALSLLRQDPRLRRVFLLDLLFASGFDAMSFLLPLYGTFIGLSASLIGMISACWSGAVLAIRLGSGWIRQRWGNWQILTICLIMVTLGFLAMPWVVWVPGLAMLAMVVGVGLGLATPMTMAMTFSLAPRERAGEIVGVRQAGMRGAHTVVPVVAGAFTGVAGIAPAFVLMALMMASGALITWRQAKAGQ